MTVLMLMVLAGCTTTVKTPFEILEPEFAQRAVTTGPLATLEGAISERSGNEHSTAGSALTASPPQM